jgi:hypothetical protein
MVQIIVIWICVFVANFLKHRMLSSLLEMRLLCDNWGNNFMDLVSSKEPLWTSALVLKGKTI